MGLLAFAMALWAAGILELPESRRRLVDWIGTFTVLAVLVTWVRRNALSLGMGTDKPDPEHRLRVRLIRSRRPPLDVIGGPEIKPLHRRTARFPS